MKNRGEAKKNQQWLLAAVSRRIELFYSFQIPQTFSLLFLQHKITFQRKYYKTKWNQKEHYSIKTPATINEIFHFQIIQQQSISEKCFKYFE